MSTVKITSPRAKVKNAIDQWTASNAEGNEATAEATQEALIDGEADSWNDDSFQEPEPDADDQEANQATADEDQATAPEGEATAALEPLKKIISKAIELPILKAASLMLAPALRWHELGFNVVPIKITFNKDTDKNDKKPLCNWKEFQNRRQRLDEVESLFKAPNITALGLVTGYIPGAEVGLTVVDVDNLAACDEMDKRLKMAGFTSNAINTARGQHHYFFTRAGEKIKKAVNIYGADPKDENSEIVDIISQGALIVAPPSFLPKNSSERGNDRYERVDGNDDFSNTPFITREGLEDLLELERGKLAYGSAAPKTTASPKQVIPFQPRIRAEFDPEKLEALEALAEPCLEDAEPINIIQEIPLATGGVAYYGEIRHDVWDMVYERKPLTFDIDENGEMINVIRRNPIYKRDENGKRITEKQTVLNYMYWRELEEGKYQPGLIFERQRDVFGGPKELAIDRYFIPLCDDIDLPSEANKILAEAGIDLNLVKRGRIDATRPYKYHFAEIAKDVYFEFDGYEGAMAEVKTRRALRELFSTFKYTGEKLAALGGKLNAKNKEHLTTEQLKRALNYAEGIAEKDEADGKGFKYNPKLSLDENIELFPGVSHNSRNNTFTSIIGEMLADGLPLKDAFWAANEMNEKNRPPMGANELKAIFYSVKKADYENHPGRHEKKAKEYEHKKALAITGEAVGETAEEIKFRPYAEDKVEKAGPLRKAPKIITPWILESFIPDGEVALCVGAGGVGKGRYTLLLAMHVAAGKDFFGLKNPKPNEGRKVLYISCEDDRETIQTMLKSLSYTDGAQPEPLFNEEELALVDENFEYIVLERDWALCQRGPGGTIERAPDNFADLMARASNADFIILDTYSTLFPINEINNNEITETINALRTICNITGAAILLNCHVNKEGASGINSETAKKIMEEIMGLTSQNVRGGTALVNNVRTVILVVGFTALAAEITFADEDTTNQNYFLVKIVKANKKCVKNPFYFKHDKFSGGIVAIEATGLRDYENVAARRNAEERKEAEFKTKQRKGNKENRDFRKQEKIDEQRKLVKALIEFIIEGELAGKEPLYKTARPFIIANGIGDTVAKRIVETALRDGQIFQAPGEKRGTHILYVLNKPPSSPDDNGDNVTQAPIDDEPKGPWDEPSATVESLRSDGQP
jgi:RecA-family ATPase